MPAGNLTGISTPGDDSFGWGFPIARSQDSLAPQDLVLVHLPSTFCACAVDAICNVVQQMLEMKYNVAFDVDRIRQDVLSVSMNWPRLETNLGISLAELAQAINAEAHVELPDRSQFRLHLEYREVHTFDEVQSQVRKMPGTASTVVVVNTHIPAQVVNVVAALRENHRSHKSSFGEDNCSSIVAISSLQPHYWEFEESNYCYGLIIDPILSASGIGQSVPPALSEEYVFVTLQELAKAIELSSIKTQRMVDILEVLCKWLEPDASTRSQALEILHSLNLHRGISTLLSRYRDRKRIVQAVCDLVCACSLGHASNASAFKESGVEDKVRAILQCYPDDRAIGRKVQDVLHAVVGED